MLKAYSMRSLRKETQSEPTATCAGAGAGPTASDDFRYRGYRARNGPSGIFGSGLKVDTRADGAIGNGLELCV